MARERSIAVVGAGFGGVGTAVMLERAGYDDVTVFEKGVTRAARSLSLCARGGGAVLAGAVGVGRGAVLGVGGAASCPPPLRASPSPTPRPAKAVAPAARSQARFRTRAQGTAAGQTRS